MRKIKAWKFLSNDHRLQYGDGRELRAGVKLADPLHMTGAIPILCESGFHASVNPRDALKYASGRTQIALVEIGGEIVHGDDKITGTTIRCLWISDAGQTLRLFAIACRWRQVGYRLRGREPSLAALWALDCAERFVLGETDEDERAAAKTAAYDAYAAAAAYAAAYDAAYDAYAAAAAYDAAYDAYAAAAAAADADAAYAAAAAADADADADAEKQTAQDELTAALMALAPKAGVQP